MMEVMLKKEFCVRYRLLEQLSNQRYSEVLMVYEIAVGKIKICKIIKSNDQENEIDLLMDLDHENILVPSNVFKLETEERELFYVMVFDFCNKFDVHEYMEDKERETKLIKELFVQMASAVQYLHENKITHGDIKTENFLVHQEDNESPTVKLTDFETAKRQTTNTTKNFIKSTLYYRAPEMYKRKKKINMFACDIYALGITLYTMLSGYFPFSENSNLQKQIKKSKLCFINDDSIDPEGLKLAKLMLNKNPKKRPKIEEILEHPFLN
eukprot:TRINITY_DN15755_c0_g1_i1.p1 TRINITY_DN15755_c0_g1~~TRINITY_DN15755_c0_g1_i1.p1  ORF type:complete len:279 (+),score=36.61 TRINITY_DN15755_c0_g1_i1:34-837(+)